MSKRIPLPDFDSMQEGDGAEAAREWLSQKFEINKPEPKVPQLSEAEMKRRIDVLRQQLADVQ